ncbi:MAG: glycosyltransferase [Firmicutes bacterium]|nr:glycosyltransferase [Bacillota bacterium]
MDKPDYGEYLATIRGMLTAFPDIRLMPAETWNDFDEYMRLAADICRGDKTAGTNGYVAALDEMTAGSGAYNEAYLLSALIRMTREAGYAERLAGLCLDGGITDTNERLFLLKQIDHLCFANNIDPGIRAAEKLRLVYLDILDRYAESYAAHCRPIPAGERDPRAAVVITGQYIGLNHGPTKTVCDRCRSLIKDMKMNVTLINSADIVSPLGRVPFFNAVAGSYNAELNGVSSVCYQDAEFGYYQFRTQNLDYDDLRGALLTVRRLRPAFIVSVTAGPNVLAELCDRIVPVISVSLTVSRVPLTATRLISTNKIPDETDLRLLKTLGLSARNIITGVFTSDFKPQTRKITRRELSLPEGGFILIVVGARLDTEITEEFLEILLSTAKYGTHIAFAGRFEKYAAFCAATDGLAERSTFLGFADDMLAVLDNCDLYVNPMRRGGGTSAVEALYKGVPVVTPDFGDVASNAGSAFIASYADMAGAIARYASDREFYASQSKKARERAAYLTDTSLHFGNIIKEAMRSPMFS